MSSPRELVRVFAVFLKLGLISFGGPIAHLGYFEKEFVQRRAWLSEAAYAELVALCQFLPGPASSQVGIALGAGRAGLAGGIAAWLGFTLPSAAIMMGFAYGLARWPAFAHSGWIHGLKLAAVAVVAQAVWSMARRLTPDGPRAVFAGIAALFVLVWPYSFAQVVAIAGGAVAGALFLHGSVPGARPSGSAPLIPRRVALAMWATFFALLVLLPALTRATHDHTIAVVDAFYRTGALVFGGGHVVLPLLRAEVVPPGWISDASFLAGYGLAQAIPGPLFTFAAYLGVAMHGDPNGWRGGLLALAAIFLPAFLLVMGVLPYWDTWRTHRRMGAALAGINAAVVGVLLAALYDPVIVTSVHAVGDLAVAVAGLVLLSVNVSPLWVVILAALSGAWLGS